MNLLQKADKKATKFSWNYEHKCLYKLYFPLETF